MKTISYKTIKQSNAVVIMGAGPSLSQLKKQVEKWYIDNSAIAIGAHYYYFLKPEYTVFTTPGKFITAQGKIPGSYIVGPRIPAKMIKSKIRSKCLRFQFSKTCAWRTDNFIEKSYSMPRLACGMASMVISLFCNPQKILIVGLDGYEIRKDNRIMIRHANDMISKKTCRKNKKDIFSLNRGKKVLENAKKTIPTMYNLLSFILNKKIKVYIFAKDKFQNIDKNKFTSKNFHIL